MLHHLDIPLPHKDGFSNVKNHYFKSVYYSNFDDYGVNANEIWMNKDWFYRSKYAVFGAGGKATSRSPPYNLKSFTRKSIE